LMILAISVLKPLCGRDSRSVNCPGYRR
jgi:hypothetical protein